MARRRRWCLAFVAAVLLHAGLLSLLALLIRGAPPTPPAAHTVREVKLVHLPPVESEPARTLPTAEPQLPPATPEAPSPESLARAPAPAPAPAPTPEPSEPTTDLGIAAEPTPGGDASRAPRKVDLFPAEVIGRIAELEELEGVALAEKRLKDWAEQWDAHRRASVGATTPAIRELAKRFDAWFMPSNKTVAERADHGLGIGNTSFLTRYLKAARQFGDGTLLGIGGMPAQVAHLEVVVEIDHDIEGIPERWRVTQSSGDSNFDDAALTAIRDGLDWSDRSQLASDRPAQRTEWSFEARAYRYFIIEYTLEPGLVARGSDLSEYDNIIGKTQILRRARLIAVAYWPARDGGPCPSGAGSGTGGDPG